MTWNYRVIEFQFGDETHRAIHEVYYDEAGNPNGYAENPASISWNADEDPGAASKILEKMQVALTKPVLTEKDFTVPAVKRVGVAKGKFEVLDSIDTHSDEVASMLRAAPSDPAS